MRNYDRRFYEEEQGGSLESAPAIVSCERLAPVVLFAAAGLLKRILARIAPGVFEAWRTAKLPHADS